MPQNLFVTHDIVDLGSTAQVQAPPTPALGGNRAAGVVSVGAVRRACAVANQPARAPIQLMWLPYTPGATNATPLGLLPVLSGPFSGCYMIAYQQGGTMRVGHVATPEAKASWNRYAATPGIHVVRGFRPHQHIVPQPAITVGNNGDYPGGVTIFGLFTNAEMYTIFAYIQQANGLVTTRYRLAHIAGPIASLSPAVLTNLP